MYGNIMKVARFRLQRTIIPALVIVATLLLGMGGIALASDISTATYQGGITVSNNSTAASQVSTVMTLSSSELIDQNWTDAAFTRMAIRSSTGADIPFMPAWSTNPWCLWVPYIGADTNMNYILYAGPSDLSSTKYWFPDTAGGTVVDDASLEPSDNFTITASGYFNTDNGTSKYIASKDKAVDLYVSPTVSGNVTADTYQEHTTTLTLLPDAAGDYTNIANAVPAVAHYLNVDDPVATPDDATTTVWTHAAAQEKDAYNLAAASYNGTVKSINTVTVYFRWIEDTDGIAQPFLRLSGSETAGTPVNTAAGWTTVSETLTRPGGGSWTEADIDDLQAVIGLQGNGGANGGQVTQVYVEINYTHTYIGLTTSVTGISSGENIIKVALNDTLFGVGAVTSTDVGLPISENLTVNLPLWHDSLTGATFTSIDSSGYTATVTGATWGNQGRIFDGNDFISITSPFASGDNFSVTFWFKQTTRADTRIIVTNLEPTVAGKQGIGIGISDTLNYLRVVYDGVAWGGWHVCPCSGPVVYGNDDTEWEYY